MTIFHVLKYPFIKPEFGLGINVICWKSLPEPVQKRIFEEWNKIPSIPRQPNEILQPIIEKVYRQALLEYEQ